MSLGLIAMLLGAFVIPCVLLWMGHRLRRRPPRWRRAFWGGLVGHVLALVIGAIAGMTPPESWAPTDYWRGALAFYSFLVLPVLGGLFGGLRR